VTSKEEIEAIDGRIENALATMFAEFYPGTVMLKFVTAIEVISPEGGQSMWLSQSESMGMWDVMGFLAFASENARVKVQQACEDDDDD
jgi:hypothetical protein